MGPIYMTSALAGTRQQDLHQKAARRRLTAGLPARSVRSVRPVRPAGPRMLQRFALRATGWAQRPAVAARPAGLMAQTSEPAAS